MKILVLSHVYPNETQPTHGLFVRERMSRVAKHVPVVVVAPIPWFPGQALIRRFWKPHFRPPVPAFEKQEGISVYHPRFFCIPGIFKWTDGFFMALSVVRLVHRLKRYEAITLIDSHFIYPEGVAAGFLGRWLKLPYTITLRGLIGRISRTHLRRWQARRAMQHAVQVFAVSDNLRQIAITVGIEPAHVRIMPNGINLEYFHPVDRQRCRREIGLPEDARILITVGGLNRRKGFHRVIEQMPALLERYPDLHYLCVGGAGPDGNELEWLRELAVRNGVAERVHFTGPVPPDRLRYCYSAADLFVLATSFEGWANVFLEAAACGLPTVTTRVGGNAEVITSEDVGLLVELGHGDELRGAIAQALDTEWDRTTILQFAQTNRWENRIPDLVQALRAAAS